MSTTVIPGLDARERHDLGGFFAHVALAILVGARGIGDGRLDGRCSRGERGCGEGQKGGNQHCFHGVLLGCIMRKLDPH
jgi:hypothetical protein